MSPQIDAQPIPAEDTQPESPKSISPEKEVQLANPQSDEQPAESTLVETVEAETNPPQPEGPCLDPHTDAQPIQAESTETIISPEKEMLPEDSPPAQPESLPGTPLQIKPKEKQKASPKPQQPQRRPTRWHLVLEGSPEPYGKKLRSAIPSRRCGSSPQLSEKSKSPTKSAPKKDKMVEQPPSKKARGSSVTAAPEEPQEESAQAPVSETAPTGVLYISQCGTNHYSFYIIEDLHFSNLSTSNDMLQMQSLIQCHRKWRRKKKRESWGF